jgi:succinate dehydrogenase / fumarate reductase flavoprotein subunit
MGGIRVHSETQMAGVPGLFAAGECAAGINGANRLGGNSLSDLIVFGKRAGEFAAQYARENKLGAIDPKQVDTAWQQALAPFERGGQGESPYTIQRDLQDMMQDLVGIVRREEEMSRALEGLNKLNERARQVGVTGHREYNPGWHTALDLQNLLIVSEAITRCALLRAGVAAPIFATIFQPGRRVGQSESGRSTANWRRHASAARTHPRCLPNSNRSSPGNE